ncbi:MAG: phospholipid scramblase-related protein [Chloroflexi bacterium]|nr:phospholipid scramblase-related protein [Chloroflexota bacterium]MDA1228791.1 phospholipid scramblase-related protein [Chloroflexota bacterium]
MVDLTQHQELVVTQQVEHLEAFTGFETANRYNIMTAEGQHLLYAFEESGTISRQFLGNHRPLSIHIVEDGSRKLLTAQRGFFWFKSHLHVRDDSDNHLGSLQRQIKFLGRRFTLEGPKGQPIAEVRGRMLRPHTFMVHEPQGEEVARVTKKWSGLLREGFTDADTFRLQFHKELDQGFRMLMLATAFAMDLDFFENNNKRSGFNIG